MSPYEVGELPHLFDPMLTIALEGGPMKTIPSSAKRSANLAFSLKKPYLQPLVLIVMESINAYGLTLDEPPVLSSAPFLI